MEFSNLPKYPPQDEPAPSQGERLREAGGPGVVSWSIIIAVVAIGLVLVGLLSLMMMGSAGFLG